MARSVDKTLAFCTVRSAGCCRVCVVKLIQLKHFIGLCEALNFHRAAEALHMSQPPLSVSIRKLEEELGAPLFERQARGITLTEAAIAALPHAREVLRAVAAMSQSVQETAGGARGLLRIGLVPSATYAFVPDVMRIFRQRHPKIELNLKEMTSVEVACHLEAGDLDVGLLRTPLVEPDGIHLEVLYQEEVMMMMPKSHRLASRRAVRLEDFKEESFIISGRARVPGLLLSCEAVGFVPQVSEETADIHTIVALVQGGLGVAVAPAAMRQAVSDRVRCASLSVQGRPLMTGLALATKVDDARLPVEAFQAVAREAATLRKGRR